MPTFGEWVREKRTSRDYNLTIAAKLTGVDASTFSRIENERTQATLNTAMRICGGFNIEFAELISDLAGRDVIDSLRPTDRDDVDKILALTLEDIRDFLQFIEIDELSAFVVLAEMLESVSKTEQELQSGESNTLTSNFDTDDIFRLIAEDPVYKVELAYPSDFGAYEVLKTYHSGGVLTLSDVGIYLRGKREASNRTLASMEASTSRSASVLSRLEGGELGRIKLQTALNLNEELGNRNGEILGMFWEAAQYQSLTSEKIKLQAGYVTSTREICDLLITLSRWQQMQKTPKWLRDFRERISNSD